MGFYYSDIKNKRKKKLLLRGRRLLYRGPRIRRLKLLRDFEPGTVYTFVPMHELDDLPDDTLLWADDDYPRNEVLT